MGPVVRRALPLAELLLETLDWPAPILLMIVPLFGIETRSCDYPEPLGWAKLGFFGAWAWAGLKGIWARYGIRFSRLDRGLFCVGGSVGTVETFAEIRSEDRISKVFHEAFFQK